MQKEAENVGNIASQESVKEPPPSTTASPGSPESPVEGFTGQTHVKDSEPSQEPMIPQEPKAVNPIVSVENFFSNDIRLSGHSLEESPCYPIISSRTDEISTDTVYYCKLHPELGSDLSD